LFKAIMTIVGYFVLD